MLTFEQKLVLVIMALKAMNEKDPERTDKIMLVIVAAGLGADPAADLKEIEAEATQYSSAI